MNTIDKTGGIDDKPRQIPNKNDRPPVTLDYNPLVAYFDAEAGRPQSLKDQTDAQAMRKLFAMQRLRVIRLMVGLSTALEKKRPGEKLPWQDDIARFEALGIDREDIFTSPRTIGFSKPTAPGTVFWGLDPDTGVDMATQLNWFIHMVLFDWKSERDARNIPFYWQPFRDAECAGRGIVDIEKKALDELDWLRSGEYIPPTPHSPRQLPTPALDALVAERREELERILTKLKTIWMNKKNDALGLYNHITHALHTSVPQHAIFVTSDKHFERCHRVKRSGKRVEMTAWELLKERNIPGQLLTPEEAVDYLTKVTGVEPTDLS